MMNTKSKTNHIKISMWNSLSTTPEKFHIGKCPRCVKIKNKNNKNYIPLRYRTLAKIK